MLTKRWRSRSSSSVSTKPDIRLHPGTTFLLTASQARLLSWQNFWQKTQGWWITLGTMMRTLPRTKMFEASDIFIFAGDSNEAQILEAGRRYMDRCLYFYICPIFVFLCIFVFGIKQKTWSGRLCWRISWTTCSMCSAMKLAAICARWKGTSYHRTLISSHPSSSIVRIKHIWRQLCTGTWHPAASNGEAQPREAHSGRSQHLTNQCEVFLVWVQKCPSP